MDNQQQHNHPESTYWTCSCGRLNNTPYCCECGSPKPQGSANPQTQETQPLNEQMDHSQAFQNTSTPENLPAPQSSPAAQGTSMLQNSPTPVPSVAPAQPKAKMGKLKMFLIVLAFVATFGFQALMYFSVFGSIYANLYMILDGDGYGYEYLLDEDESLSNSFKSEKDEIAYSNKQFREYYDLESTSSDSIGINELDTVAKDYYANQSKSGSDYSPGVYTVGTDINAGRYLIYGSQKEISTFFVLNKHEDSDSYDVMVLNTYYGNNQIDLAEGEIIICDSEKGFCLKSDFTSSFTSPYKSGVYEVGKDIPAGTYSLSAGEAQDYYAYYIMKDLNYTKASISDSKAAYSVGGNTEVTLTEGTFVEFYNVTAKTKTSSSASAAFA